MARPRRVDPELVTQAQAAVRDADNVEALRCAQAVAATGAIGSDAGAERSGTGHRPSHRAQATSAPAPAVGQTGRNPTELGIIRSEVWQCFGSINGVGLRDRTIRDAWIREGRQFNVPANAWKQTLADAIANIKACLLYTSPSPRD